MTKTKTITTGECMKPGGKGTVFKYLRSGDFYSISDGYNHIELISKVNFKAEYQVIN